MEWKSPSLIFISFHLQEANDETSGHILNAGGVESTSVPQEVNDETYELMNTEGVGSTNDLHNDRKDSVQTQLRLIREQWCAVGEMNAQIEEVKKIFSSSLANALDESKQILGVDGKLTAFSYNRFNEDFPTEIAIPVGESVKVTELLNSLEQITGRNSACPGLAQKILNTFKCTLQKTNVGLADEAADTFSQLLEPLSFFAIKDLKSHDNKSFLQKLKTAEEALNSYRSIMAGKLLENPEDHVQRSSTLQALLQVLFAKRS